MRSNVKWSDIRRDKVPRDQEANAAAGAQALRDALELRDGGDLRDLRRDRGITQVELASRLGKTQSGISELEGRDDFYMSSLREYVEALGGRLRVTAEFDEERRPIAVGDRDDG